MNRLLLSCILVACLAGNAAAAETFTIGVTPFPHKDIMLVVKDLLAKKGIALTIREFSDYVQPNLALADGTLDANFFQHIPYLENMNMEKRLNLAWVAKVHIEPLGLYSRKIKSLDELKKGDTIALPNDPTNGARALHLLEKHGILTVKAGEMVTVRDIRRNPRGLKFREVEAARLPRILQDVHAAVINTNFAAEAGLVPSRDALVIEDKDSPYANVVAVRGDDTDTPAVRALVRASNSPEVRAYIEQHLIPKGIVPAF